MALLNLQSSQSDKNPFGDRLPVGSNREEEVFKEPININISAHRVLFLLLMLIRYRSLNVDELNRHLFDHPGIQRAYPSETMTKYINTLREVGCMIPRSTARNDYSYELQRNPFPLTLTETEHVLLHQLFSILSRQPNVSDYRELWEQLCWCCVLPTEEPLSVSMSSLSSAFTPQLNSTVPVWIRKKEDYQCYLRYCQESYTIELYFHDDTEEDPVYILFEPYEVIERSNEIILLGLDKQSQRQRELQVQRILWSRQLPTKNHRSILRTVVVFALYGRLAKRYRPYPDERIVYSSETTLHVKSKVADTSALVRRLLKYGESCEILSPDHLRNHMEVHLTQLLDHLLIQDLNA